MGEAAFTRCSRRGLAPRGSQALASVPGCSVPVDQVWVQLEARGAWPSPDPAPDLLAEGGVGNVLGPSHSYLAHGMAVSFPNVKPRGDF